jgi:hypothetical protein
MKTVIKNEVALFIVYNFSKLRKVLFEGRGKDVKPFVIEIG